MKKLLFVLIYMVLFPLFNSNLYGQEKVKEIPYTGEIEYKQIIDWIFSIPPDMRIIKSFSFSVVQENKMID